ncbi:hypothetical protein KY289_001693 [Solanum tuberosum]|nr:hypothetical protein KY289_001693 [Solanum tuberosum]
MTILMAFQTPEVEVIGLATIFGNVTTKDATRNALLLCEAAGYPDVPVVEGSSEPSNSNIFFSLQSHILYIPKRQVITAASLEHTGEPCVVDFVHGSVGLGNLFLPSPNSKKIDKSVSEFLVEKVSEYPGEMSILALRPFTNLALWDSTFASKVKRVVVLGDSFFAVENVNPAAQANVGDFFPNGVEVRSACTPPFPGPISEITFGMLLLTKHIYGDPKAADVVFTWGTNIHVVGINITTQVQLKDADLEELKQSEGKHAKFVCDMSKFYRDWHVKFSRCLCSTSHANVENRVDINTLLEDEEHIIECEKVPSCRVRWRIMACPLAA